MGQKIYNFYWYFKNISMWNARRGTDCHNYFPKTKNFCLLWLWPAFSFARSADFLAFVAALTITSLCFSQIVVSEGVHLLRGGGVVIKTIEKGIVFTLLFCLECLRIIMSDVWSRAWCETQKIPNFAVKGKNLYYLVSNLNSILLAGITPSNEVRDAPKYLRPISS